MRAIVSQSLKKQQAGLKIGNMHFLRRARR